MVLIDVLIDALLIVDQKKAFKKQPHLKCSRDAIPIFVDMELTPSFKVKIEKMGVLKNVKYHICINWDVRSINWASRPDTMERKWFSNTNIFICRCIPCHAPNIIYTE